MSTIRTWQFGGVTFDRRDSAEDKAVSLPRHFHDEYQIIVGECMTTQYHYRGGLHVAPPGSLVVLQPGEVHSALGLADAAPHVPLRTLLIPAAGFAEFALDAGVKLAESPFFPQPVLSDESLVSTFLSLHKLLELHASTLEKEAKLSSALARLLAWQSSDFLKLAAVRRERAAVRCVRECLDEKYDQNISLSQLSELTGLSPFYLCRMFSSEVGLPPQEYQSQVRVERAKALLVQGHSIGEVALMTGFADQSHFTRQFRKIVGVTPKRYQRHL